VFCMDLPPRIYESLKTLGCLANARGPLQAHEIASATGLPPAQTAKILQSMTWAGFVESRRGARGGFWLVIPASRIRVTDVIEFFSHHPQNTSGHNSDPVVQALALANARCQREYRHVTVADIAKLDRLEHSKRTGRNRNSSASRQRKKKSAATN
jgi:Rrf2 family protein